MTNPEQREKIARIIDPNAWGDLGHDSYLERADEWERKGRPAQDALTSGYREKARAMVQPSLAKADAIIALDPAPTSNEREDADGVFKETGISLKMPESADESYPTDAELDDAVRHTFGERFVDTPRPAPDVESAS